MSLYSMARIRRLNIRGLVLTEQHARRLTPKAQARVVRQAPPITWTPAGTTADPLAYHDLYTAHADGAFVPRGKGKAMHLLVKLPESVPVTTTGDAEAALRLVVDFGRSVFGDRAVFAARMDRDETSLTNAELFIAPRYVKRTKHTEKDAISLSRHLKELAERHGGLPQNKDILRRQGQVLQDAFAQFLRARGYQALRGQPKKTTAPDWTAPEAYAARTDRAIAAADREVANDLYAEAAAEHEHVEGERQIIARERSDVERDRLELSDDRARIDQALDDTALACGKMVDAAQAEAGRLLAEAKDDARRRRALADEEASRIVAGAAATAQEVVRRAQVEAKRLRGDAKDTAEQLIASAREAADADALRRTEVINRRERAAASAEQRVREMTAIAELTADRSRAEAHAAEERRRDAKIAADAADLRMAAAEQAARDTGITSAQIALVGRAIGNEALDPFPAPTAPSGLDMDEAAMTAPERVAYRAPWSAISRAVAQTIGAALAKLADLKRAAEQMMKQAKDALAEVEREQVALREANLTLKADRYRLMMDRKEIEKHQRTATAFIEAFEAVPEAERTPRVAAALATGGVLAQAAITPIKSPVASKGPDRRDDTEGLPPSRGGTGR